MAFSIVGLDGIERELGSVIAQSCEMSHGLATIAGYILRETTEAAQRDIGRFAGSTSYGAAIERRREIERGGGRGVVDAVYACGCRGQG